MIEKDIKIRNHVLRVVSTHQDFGSGSFDPGLHLFLKGPNGSISGFGPKGFPLHWRIRKFQTRFPRLLTYGWHRRYPGHMRNSSNSLYIPIPHLTERMIYGDRLYRVPGVSRFSKAQYRFFKNHLGRS